MANPQARITPIGVRPDSLQGEDGALSTSRSNTAGPCTSGPPVTRSLGLFIAASDRPDAEGTMALYFAEGGHVLLTNDDTAQESMQWAIYNYDNKPQYGASRSFSAPGAPSSMYLVVSVAFLPAGLARQAARMSPTPPPCGGSGPASSSTSPTPTSQSENMDMALLHSTMTCLQQQVLYESTREFDKYYGRTTPHVSNQARLLVRDPIGEKHANYSAQQSKARRDGRGLMVLSVPARVAWWTSTTGMPTKWNGALNRTHPVAAQAEKEKTTSWPTTRLRAMAQSNETFLYVGEIL
ncbi:hypothetical protein BJ138DRAFT_1122210 [Hygrophoropsis aurantiaca]|uniref:Uncharacterized protein n=1 Tax=Hygrophoropsis aurantiaca TaxID=72124 RepID=A0ACB8ARV7_9AGAM|nr:hypothetical protein BJ138DRAFT_1122210 [Hygrophoropsis aurantiaca]